MLLHKHLHSIFLSLSLSYSLFHSKSTMRAFSARRKSCSKEECSSSTGSIGDLPLDPEGRRLRGSSLSLYGRTGSIYIYISIYVLYIYEYREQRNRCTYPLEDDDTYVAGLISTRTTAPYVLYPPLYVYWYIYPLLTYDLTFKYITVCKYVSIYTHTRERRYQRTRLERRRDATASDD